MTLYYRTYTPGWKTTGWCTTPQYPGQQPCANGEDFPLDEYAVVGLAEWLRLRHLDLPPIPAHYSGYVAQRKDNGQWVIPVPVKLVADSAD